LLNKIAASYSPLLGDEAVFVCLAAKQKEKYWKRGNPKQREE
jgi:hypothetical protein